jgi:hypothetical protein
MLIRQCDRCGSRSQAKAVRGESTFKQFGSEDTITMSMELKFDGADICPECAAWFIKEAKWK